ncbi:MAG: beta-N-acetylhexosaminidase [Paraprevotella sp.]|nr:beta-N-acetylhexosaminidase [Paraprevotella sp.]
MKHLLFVIVGVLSCSSMVAQDNLSALLPMPNEISLKDTDVCFTIDGRKTSISIGSDELSFAARKLQDAIYENMQETVNISKDGDGELKLLLDHSLKNKEQYTIDVSNDGIVIRGASKGAVFYGVVTLEQILTGDRCHTSRHQVKGICVNDTPRFGYRAFMLDPARNFLPVESVKFFIDQMAQYKYNVLQLHLTDDQGWRIHIDKYPQLASKDHYTKEDIKEIVRYAAQRNVTVVPELDIPGHTSAMLAAFPEFKCGHKDSVSIEIGKTVNMMLCASADGVYSVIDDIIKEIAGMFPAEYIHLGGDEAAIADNWAKCPRCNRLMEKSGYSKPSQLMIPFFAKVMKSVKKNGKRTILWCELDNIYPPANDYLFPYPKETVLVSWRGGLTPKCLELTHDHGNPLIMAPGEYAYLDYPQYKGDFPEFNNWGMPITTLETCYGFDPGYGQAGKKQEHIMGVMATLWGEAIKDINRATYMAYPRGLALAEAGWTDMENRDWKSFKNRMYPNIMKLMKHGVSVRVPFEIEQNLGNYK